jgi:uncharacterized protein Yka (UPF0111/DUF47 family)
MGLQDMVRWLLPREDRFYELIERQGVLLDEAATALMELAGPAEPAEVHEKVREIEHRADAIVYEIEEQLAAVFVTPIDREDIQLLASALDDIVDDINLTARTFVLFGVARPTPPMVGMMEVLAKMAAFLRSELPALRAHEYTRLIAAGRVIKQHEKEGDRIFRTAVSELFHDPEIDAKELLRQKEVLEDLELAIDRCETVSERLKNLAVKHG